MKDTLGLRIPGILPSIDSRYVIKKELGKGAYGTVYLAVDKETREEWVIPILLTLKSCAQTHKQRVPDKNGCKESVEGDHDSPSMPPPQHCRTEVRN